MVTFSQALAAEKTKIEAAIADAATNDPDVNIDHLWNRYLQIYAAASGSDDVGTIILGTFQAIADGTGYTIGDILVYRQTPPDAPEYLNASTGLIVTPDGADLGPVGGAASAVSVTSGTITANAGTNLNTSALALEEGGILADIDTKLGATLTVNTGLDLSALALEEGGVLAAINTKLGATLTVDTGLDLSTLATASNQADIELELAELNTALADQALLNKRRLAGQTATAFGGGSPTTTSGDQTGKGVSAPASGRRIVLTQLTIQNGSEANTITVVLGGLGRSIVAPPKGGGIDWHEEFRLPAETAFVPNVSAAETCHIAGRYYLETVATGEPV